MFHYIGGEMMLSVFTHFSTLTVTLYHSKSVFLNWYLLVLETEQEKNIILYVSRCCQQ